MNNLNTGSDASLAELLTLTEEVNNRGYVLYRNTAGELHRVHGPAVIRPDGLIHGGRLPAHWADRMRQTDLSKARGKSL